MKRKLFLALIALLAIGLLFVACPDPNGNNGGESEMPKLDPLYQANSPVEPTNGYKDYPKDQYELSDGTMSWYSTFAGTGNVGFIEANSDCTYKVSIQTNPGGRSIVSFNSDDYTFGRGYYLSVNFPEGAAYKPLLAMTYAAQGVNGANGAWSTVHYENTVGSFIPTDETVYLAGDYAFAWENLENKSIYRNITLELVWHTKESTGSYEFTLKKLLITDGEDLTPPAYNEGWTPTPVNAPAGWVDFDADLTETSYYPWSSDNSITKNANGTYTVSLSTITPGYSTVTIPLATGSDVSAGGYYVTVTLPDNGIKIANFVTTPNGNLWAGEIQTADHANYETGKYVVGRIDNLWNSIGAADENSTAITSIELAFYWVSETVTGEEQFEFTINAIKVPDPEGYVPPPDPWDDFVDFYPAGGTLTSSTIGPNWNETVNQATISFENTNGKLFQGGHYVSVTFSAANETTPTVVMSTSYDAAGDVQDGWVSQKSVDVTSDTVVIYWDGNTWAGTPSDTSHKKIDLYFQWPIDDVSGVGKTISITVNAVKVGALVD
jgi:hypothetical protein